MKKIEIGGAEIGLYGLEEVFEEVKQLGIADDILKEELLKRVKVYNHIPEDREDQYRTAVFEAYQTFLAEIA